MSLLGDPKEARGLSSTLIRRCPEEPLDERPVDETVIDSKDMELFFGCLDHFSSQGLTGRDEGRSMYRRKRGRRVGQF